MPVPTELSNIPAGEPIELARKSLIDEIRRHAAERGITQSEIADRTGLRQSNVSRVFAGKYPPTLDTLIKIAKALDLSVIVTEN